MNRRQVLAAGCTVLIRPGTANAARMLTSPLDLLRHTVPRLPVGRVDITDAHGQELPLDVFRGRLVVMNIWASWCFPCRDEMPALSRLAASQSSNLVVLPVAIERRGAEAVATFYRETGISNLPMLLGDGRNIARVFNEWGLPFTVLIDVNSHEFGRVVGAARWDDPAFIRWLSDQA